jgi:hypothetical protein
MALPKRDGGVKAPTCRASRRPSVSTAACTFEPLRRLAPSYPTRAPDSGVDCSVRLSRIIAVGCALRPANSRRNMCRSSTMVSKQRARIQRCAC